MATARISRTQAETTEAEQVAPDGVRDRAARRQHLRIVRDQERPWFRVRLTPRSGIAVTVLLFAALFAVAASHALLIESQARLDRLDQEVGEEQARYLDLQAEVSLLESHERILNEADERGMVRSEDPGWIVQTQPVDDGDEAVEPVGPGTSQVDLKPYLDTTP
jgi:hypothetical protein